MKIMILIVTAFAFCTNSLSQVTEEWVTRYNGSVNDQPTAIAVDIYGNVYVTGIILGTGSIVNPWDIVTIKYNPSGEEAWVRTFGLDNRKEEAYDIKVDNIGNVYITGYAVGDFEGSAFLTIKYDANGDTVWVRKYSGLLPNWTNNGRAIEVDTITGMVYVTGSSKGILSFDDFDYATIAYKPDGEQFWVARYDGPGISKNFTTAMTFRPGEVLVTGTSKERNDSYPHILTIKYAAGSGDTLWTRRYYNPANFFVEPKSITLDQSGNVYITGRINSSQFPQDSDYLTIKYSPDGEELWAAVYHNIETDEAVSVAVDNSGNVYVTGTSHGLLTGRDYATIKYNSSGEEQWVKRYNGPLPTLINADFAYSLAVDDMSNVYVTGGSVGLNENMDFFTIKYNSDGDSIWAARYNGPANGNDAAVAVKLDTSGNVYVTGGSSGDYTTIKYSQQITEVENNTTNIPNDYILYQNYPNPFNPVTNIKFSMPKESNVTLKIYNLLGETIASFINRVLPAGLNEFQLDASSLTSGMYIYKLEADDFISVKKMVYLK